MGLFALLMILNLVHFGAHRYRRTGARLIYISTLTGVRKGILNGLVIASVAGFIYAVLTASSSWFYMIPTYLNCYHMAIVSIYCRAHELDE